MELERREYEHRAIADIESALSAHRRVLAVGPTGCGKTVIASLLMKARADRADRILFIAHRRELIDQARRTLDGLGVDVGVMMAQDEELHGDRWVRPDARVQVGSVQTVARRGVPPGIGLVIFDEAHRVMADSYQAIAQRARTRILGLTATPARADGKALGEFFQALVTIAKPSELYELGYLARPTTYVAPKSVIEQLEKRLRGIRSYMGDFEHRALARAAGAKVFVGNVVSEAKRLAPGVPKVVFATSVSHSQRLARAFADAGIASAHVDAETLVDERTRTLDALRDGSIEVVCNVDVLSEGWDLPSLGAVILARPTKSVTRFLQMTGRVQRPWKGRTPLIIDHANNALRLQLDPALDIEWSLEGAREKHRGAPVLKACVQCLATIPAGMMTCLWCGAEQPAPERTATEEVEAELERLRAERFRAARVRLAAMAKKKNAPPGWVDRVIAGACS